MFHRSIHAGSLAAVLAVASVAGLAAISFPQSAPPASAAIEVPATANIFWAGRAGEPPAGTIPVVIVLGPGSVGKTITFTNVRGTVDCGLGVAAGPDGGTCATRTDVESFQGIAGITHRTRTMFLVGVFLGDGVPAGTAPPRVDVTDRTQDPVFSPALHGVFFIGDGLTGTGTGAIQRFVVPDGAKRLALGFVDAWDGAVVAGPPCCYGDNKGTVTANVGFAPQAAPPSPASPPASVPAAPPPSEPSVTAGMPPATQAARPRSLTGPWMPAADAAYTGKTQAIFVQDGQRLTMWIASSQFGAWVTTMCEGTFAATQIAMACAPVPSGNPLNLPRSTMNLILSTDGNHLDGVMVDADGKRQPSNWTRKPWDSGPDGWTGPIR